MKRAKKDVTIPLVKLGNNRLPMPPSTIEWEEVGQQSISVSWLGNHKPANCRLLETRDGVACVDVSQRRAYEFKGDELVAIVRCTNEPIRVGLVDRIDKEHDFVTIFLSPIESSHRGPMERTYNLALNGNDNDHIIGLVVFLLIRGWK